MMLMSNPGQDLQAMRKIVDSKCVICGEPIRGTKKKKFCSNKCQQKDKYQKQKDKSPQRKLVEAFGNDLDNLPKRAQQVCRDMKVLTIEQILHGKF